MLGWRNIKMRGKLLLGFGMLLAVFAAAIALAWFDIDGVMNTNTYISDVVLASSDDSTDLERDFYESALVAKALESNETPENIAAMKEKMAVLKTGFNGMRALRESQPELQAPKYWIDVVSPLTFSYNDSMLRTYALIETKNKLYAAIGKAGLNASKSAVDTVDMFPDYIKEELRKLTDGDKIASIVDRWDLADVILAGIIDARRVMQKAMMERDPATMTNLLPNIEKLQADAKKQVELTSDPGRKKIAQGLADDLNTYHSVIVDFAKCYEELNKESKIRADLISKLATETTNASATAITRINDLTAKSVVDLRKSVNVLIASAVVAIILGIVIALFIARGIAGPLGRIVGIAERAKGGDLTIAPEDFGYEGKDEMGELVTALSEMVKAQEMALQDIVAVAGDLADESHSLSEIAEQSNASM